MFIFPARTKQKNFYFVLNSWVFFFTNNIYEKYVDMKEVIVVNVFDLKTEKFTFVLLPDNKIFKARYYDLLKQRVNEGYNYLTLQQFQKLELQLNVY